MQHKLLSALTGVLTAGALLLASVPVSPQAAEGTSGVYVESHTIEEIRAYVEAHSFSTSGSPVYTTEPDLTAFTPGVLSEESLNNALNALNVVRYIAGLDEVVLKESYCNLVSAAALCNAANNTLTHSPAQPAGMPDDIYAQAKQGAGSSNLGVGYSNLAGSVVYGYMEDSDPYNIDRVGHRRWCLNPVMGATGFGQCGSYSGMYAFDRSNSSATQTGVCWPAQEMPVEYFANSWYDFAWSYTGGKGCPDVSAVSVDVTSTTDGSHWHFDKSQADGDFYVNTNGYGEGFAVIFRPENLSYHDGDTFQVEIGGLREPVSYTVHFFSLYDGTDPEPTEEETSTTGQTLYIGDVNLDGQVDVTDLIVLQKHLHGLYPLDWYAFFCADLTGDLDIDVYDLALLKRRLLSN